MNGVRLADAVCLTDIELGQGEKPPEGWEPLTLRAEPMTITAKMKKNMFCGGGRRRFIKLCMGVGGLDRNRANEWADWVARINRKNSLSYADLYRVMLWT